MNRPGISTPNGQGMQYRQPVQGMRWARLSMRTARVSAFCSDFVSGWKGDIAARLSASCSSLLMPESTTSTPGRLAAKRMAQDAMLRPGAFAFSTASASGHREASAPPRTGSITMHGRPYSCNISYCSRARCTVQSR